MVATLTLTLEPGDPTVVRAVGEVDLASSSQLRELLVPQARAGDTVLDMRGVVFLDSAGISVLIAAHKQAKVAGNGFVVRGAHGMALRALLALRLDTVLTVERG